MNSDVLAPARRKDWDTYRAVNTALSFLEKGASKVDVFTVLLEIGVSRTRAGELVAGVNVR